MAIFGVFFGQKISKTLKICCAGFIGFRGVTDPQVMFQLFVWDHFSPLLMSQTQVFAPRRYLLVLCVHRVYPLVSSGCHRGPKLFFWGVPGVKKSIFPLWSGIVLGWSEWPNNAPKPPQKRFYSLTVHQPGIQSHHSGCLVGAKIVFLL